MHSSKRIILASLIALAAVPALAADLVTTTTHVTWASAPRGGANEGEVMITNNTGADVRVRMSLRVVYSNGTVQQLTGIADPGVIPPGGGFVQSVFFVIPADAPLGPAQFVADVTASSGGQREQETSSAGFEVVP